MSTRRLGVAVAVLGGFLYAVGGSDGTSPLNTGMVLDHGVAVSFTKKQKKSLTFVHMLLWHLTPTQTVKSILVSSYANCGSPQQHNVPHHTTKTERQAPQIPVQLCIYGIWQEHGRPSPTQYAKDPLPIFVPLSDTTGHPQRPPDHVLTQKWHTTKHFDSSLRVTLALFWIRLNWQSVIQVFPLFVQFFYKDKLSRAGEVQGQWR